MPHMDRPRVLSWASEIDDATLDQAARTASLPFVVDHVALMPDAHLGKGATVGSVIPTAGAIIPAAVGVDIGCGMIAVETGMGASGLPDDLTDLLRRIEQAVPAGVGNGHESYSAARDMHRLGSPATTFDDELSHRAIRQLGTLGSGNHFIEVSLDGDDGVWVVLHSGSRGVGNRLAQAHIATAKKLMERMFVTLDDPELAYLVEHTPEFDAYITDLLWAQRYAALNRDRMMDAVLRELAEVADYDGHEVRRINCHHNYATKEHHNGRNIWVTRKGAIRARVGDWGVIPGSMATSSFIVRGLGNPASFDSASHGAGRRMSRTKAKRTFTADDLAASMGNVTWLAGKAGKLVDEIPASYKDITTVMADQADLVEVVAELHQVLNYKGT